MNAKNFFALVAVVALAGAGGWYAGRMRTATAPPFTAANNGRKVLYYQSAMHPWIKSDKPGRCTICGMELVPVYEGEKGLDVTPGIVALGSNSIQVIHVQSERVERRRLTRKLRVAGIVEDDDTRHRIVSAYMDARVDRLAVNYVGAEVAPGQVLASVYSPMLLTMEREYAALARPGGSTNGGAPATDHLHLAGAAAQRLKRYGLTDAQIAALPDKAQDDLQTEILSPMAGTVVSRSVYEGQYVKEGDRLFEIADFSTMWFKFDAYERDLAWIKPGQAVEAAIPSAPGKTFPGKVVFIEPTVQDLTRSVKVRVELPNPLVDMDGTKRRELPHRIYAEATVNVEIPEVLAVPRTAVLLTGARAVAYVDQGGGAYEQRRLTLGRVGDDAWEVLDGLRAGERVVTAGNLLIDAQAQLNDSARQNSAAAPAAVALNDDQRRVAQEFLAAAAAVSQALANDDLAAFNDRAVKLHPTIPALVKVADAVKILQPGVQTIEASGHLEPAMDLAAARKAFLPFSIATAEFFRQLRAAAPGLVPLKIYRCPMTDKAIPGADKIGYWIQSEGAAHNPFFGKAMADCGTEVPE